MKHCKQATLLAIWILLISSGVMIVWSILQWLTASLPEDVTIFSPRTIREIFSGNPASVDWEPLHLAAATIFSVCSAILIHIRRNRKVGNLGEPSLKAAWKHQRTRLLGEIGSEIEQALKQITEATGDLPVPFQFTKRSLLSTLSRDDRRLGSDTEFSSDTSKKKTLKRILAEKGRFLFVTGEAGAGKSTFLLKLMKQQRRLCIENNHIPIPLFVSFANWYGRVSNFKIWAVKQIVRTYSIGEEMVSQILDSGYATIYFDGFDEVEADKLTSLSGAINLFVKDHQVDIIIATREGTFLSLDGKTDYSALTSLKPLNQNEVESRLIEFLGDQTEKIEFINGNEDLMKIVKIPLYLKTFIQGLGNGPDLNWNYDDSEFGRQNLKEDILHTYLDSAVRGTVGRSYDDSAEEIFVLLRNLAHVLHDWKVEWFNFNLYEIRFLRSPMKYIASILTVNAALFAGFGGLCGWLFGGVIGIVVGVFSGIAVGATGSWNAYYFVSSVFALCVLLSFFHPWLFPLALVSVLAAVIVLQRNGDRMLHYVALVKDEVLQEISTALEYSHLDDLEGREIFPSQENAVNFLSLAAFVVVATIAFYFRLPQLMCVAAVICFPSLYRLYLRKRVESIGLRTALRAEGLVSGSPAEGIVRAKLDDLTKKGVLRKSTRGWQFIHRDVKAVASNHHLYLFSLARRESKRNKQTEGE